MQYRLKLQELAEANGRPFRIALVGAGQMGRGFASQSHRLGLQVAAVADIAVERINQAYNDLGLEAPVISSDVAELNAAIAAGSVSRGNLCVVTKVGLMQGDDLGHARQRPRTRRRERADHGTAKAHDRRLMLVVLLLLILLPDAELAEHPVQHILGIHNTDKIRQRLTRRVEMHSRHRRR